VIEGEEGADLVWVNDSDDVASGAQLYYGRFVRRGLSGSLFTCTVKISIYSTLHSSLSGKPDPRIQQVVMDR
jgi:hypothetical protein